MAIGLILISGVYRVGVYLCKLLSFLFHQFWKLRVIIGISFPQRFLNLMHFCIAVASYVALIAFPGVVTKSFCLNVSELIVCFTLGTYTFRGSEENKMKELSDSHPTRNRATPRAPAAKSSKMYLVFLLFHQIWNLREIMALVGHFTALECLSLFLFLFTYLLI